PPPAQFLQADGVHIEKVLEAKPSAAAAKRRDAGPPALDVRTNLAPGESAILAIRHASGALTFHAPTERIAGPARRGTTAAPAVAVFHVPVRRLQEETARRGIFTTALKAFVIKVTKAALDKIVGIALPVLAQRWETSTWQKKGLREGWFKVTPNGANGLTLTSGVPSPGERTLLFVHGTFSNADGGFGSLAAGNFFQNVQSLYGDRIYAFNHFTISRTPEENARQLLADLPDGEHQFDVVTHSRGGLVLRNLVERASQLGSTAVRFKLRHAVLVASPNDGTPLATPARWQETVGWLANILELFPDNPFTTGAEFISQALVWLAGHAAGDLPGLRSMDGGGPLVADLQAPPPPPPDAYSALVSNYQPDGALWQRAVDAGVDWFFGSANDLVVPTEGGWLIDRDGVSHIPAERIGCFGPGGNLGAGTPPTHVSFFGRGETSEFIAKALSGAPHNLAAVDPATQLPSRRLSRSAQPVASIPSAVPAATAPAELTKVTPPRLLPMAPLGIDQDTFHLLVIDDGESNPDPDKPSAHARLLASWGGARVMTRIRLRKEKPSDPITGFGQIIATHERIKKYTNENAGSLPDSAELLNFGCTLFETLFQGDVRRLYDEARSRARRHKLDFVLTSMIPWIAEKPWEFAYDKARESFLATEEVHFVRNVLTAVPADTVDPADGLLRILIASAQPKSLGALSIDQEIEFIQNDFKPLTDAGLVSIKILPSATPSAIHRELESGNYRVLHFIGHGEYKDGEGWLAFENASGDMALLGERSMREIFCGRGLSLVFLNSCQSGTGGNSDFNRGAAQSLVAHGLPALVANQYSVGDSAAASFAQYFYASLAQGQTIGHAAREARIAVNYSLQGDVIDWAVPVVYARDPNAPLCVQPSKPGAGGMPITPASAALRSAAAAGFRRRVAVWDVDRAFPGLQATLDRMSTAQTNYIRADVSAPLDAFDYSSGTRRIAADTLATRLAGKPADLHANLLVCITTHLLSGDNDRLWLPSKSRPVAVVSVADASDKSLAGALKSVADGGQPSAPRKATRARKRARK
ncbi:MAG TPA: CHAT domain-containing protein, partial [Thermoanaerobaculia bacterium]|nr:CHAT domain-containing protein [Thermoanaerobaculia bacterium]